MVKKIDQKIETRGGRYKNPRVFTEQGVAMLAAILKSKVAVEVSIQIMDAFVAMRRYISNSILEQIYINNLGLEDREQIKLLQESFSKLEEKDCVNMIYFEGPIYDVYFKIVDICNLAKTELIIIDAYVDKIILDIISNLNIKVIVITKSKTN